MKKMLNELVRYGKFAFALAFALCCFNASATAITPAEHFAKKIDFTIGGYSGTDTLAHFPVLVKLSASAVSGFNYSECAQNSIRFLDGSGNLIPHEVDTWNDSGESFIWVSVPSLSGTSTKITMCYGGNGATCDAATGNVWTDASYKSVWHLNIASNSTSDSATSANTASVLNSNEYCGAGTGLIGGGYFCEQNTAVHALEAPASASASFAPTTANTLTYTAWVRQIGGYTASTSPEGYDQIRWGEWGNCGTIWHTGNNNGNSNTGIGIGVESGKSNDSSAFAYFDAKLNLRPAVTNIYDGEWHQVVARYVPNGDNATVTIWVDGQQKCSITGKYTNPSTSSDKVYMGARINSNNDCVWTGGLDEMRFRDAASSDDWIAAEYANVTLTSFMSNSGAVNIGDEPLALGWTAEPMSANGDTIRTDGVFKYGYARNDVNAVGQYTVNGVTFTALHDGGDFRNTDKNPNVVVSPGDFDWVGSLGDEGASGDYGKMLANAFGSTNLKGDYTFTLKNLEAGKTYLVQVVAHRTGQPYPVTSPDSTKVIYAGGTDWTYGGSLICVFDANTTEYSFTLNYGTWIMLNAIQVRELGDAPVKPAPWDSEHGPFAKRIAFTASGYEGSETLENFPVLVRLSTAISGFNYTDCGTNGANIQFADDNGHVLPYEIDTWNASGESLIWVNVASLSRGARFYMYFGGTPSAANISTSTWNSNYVGVWHMSEVKGSVADATGHGLTAVPTGSNGQYNDQVATTCCRYTGTDAPVGYARTTSTTQAVGGNDGRLVIAHDNQLNIGDTFTFSTWVRKTTNENYTRIVSKKSAYTSGTGWEVEVSGNTFNARGVSSGKTANECTGDFPTMMSNWVHVVVVYDNTTITVYGNGEAIKTNTVAGAANDSDRSLVIGANASDSFGNRINGAFDECRLLDAVASADWVKAEYQQSAKPEFLVAGAVETHVASTYTVSWTGGVNATVVATVDSTPIDTGDSVEDGKTVCFTVTPANGYEFASAPTGWELSSGNLTKNVTVSGAAITETIPSATAIIYPFYVDGTGYDSFTNAYKAVVNGGTITLGQDATELLDAYSGKNFTIDLHGNAFTGQRGWCCDHVTIRDSVGGGSFSDDEVNLEEGYLDLSGLDPNQIVGKISCIKKSITVSFPVSMSLADCSAKITGQVTGTKIVVNGDTYVWNGTAWVAQTTPEGDWFVSSSGNDTSNDGQSADHPFKTIHRAVEAASDNQTICILAGTYTLTNRIDLTGKNIKLTFVGEGWDKTIVNAAPGKGCFKLDGGSKLVGLTLTGGSYGDGAGVRIINGSVSWCKICNNTGTGTTCGGAGVSFTGGQGSIDHCIVCTNVISTVNGGSGWGAGIGAKGLNGDVLIDTCLVYGNTNNKGSAGGIGFDEPNHKVTVRNCTIVGNTGSSNVGGLYFNNSKDGAELVLVNNIITQNINGGNESNTFIEKAKVNTTESSKCLITGTTANYSASIYKDVGMQGLISGCLTTAPIFAGTGDYHLAAGSAGIAAGATYTGIGEDLDNKAFAATPSMGCYEYDGVAPTTYAVTWSGAANATVSAKVDGAAITSGASVEDGKEVVFTVTPNSGYEFATASDGWTKSGANLTKTVTVNGAAVAVVIPGATAIPVVATPAFSPVAGTITEATDVTITCATDGATIYYTTNGDDPTSSSTQYTAPIAVSATTTIKAIAVKSGYLDSSIASATYTYEAPQPTDPAIGSLVITPNGSTAWFSLSGITLGTDSSGVPATSYSVYFAVTNSSESEIKRGTKLTGQSSSSCSFVVADIPDGTYTGHVTITTDRGKTATKYAEFTIDTSSEEPTIPLGWTASPMTGSGDICTDGVLLYAYMRGNKSSTTYIINTVPFSGYGNANLSELTSLNFTYAGVSYRDANTSVDTDDPYEQMLGLNWRGNAGNNNLVLKNLVAGNTYLVQIVLKSTDSLGGNLYGMPEDGASTTAPGGVAIAYASGDGWENGGSLIGVFKATGSTESIALSSSVCTVLNAIQVRDVSPVETVTPGSSASDTRNKIQAAIDRAAPAHREVKLSSGTFEINEQLYVTNGVTLTGQGWDETIVKFMAQGDFATDARCALIDGGAKIQGVMLTGGRCYGQWDNSPGGVKVVDGTISWCCISNNACTALGSGRGGGVFIMKGQIDHTIIAYNKCDVGNGGGIAGHWNNGEFVGPVIIDTCLIYGNSVSTGEGGGLGFTSNDGNALVQVRNSTIVGNTATKNGGGIDGGPKYELVNCIVSGNSSTAGEANIHATLVATSANNLIDEDVAMIFVDASTHNYHLNDYSIASGSGTTYVGSAGNVDLDHVAFDVPPSIGCYEYSGVGILPEDTAAETRQAIQDAIDAVAPAHGTVHLGEGTFEIDQQLYVTNGVTLTGQGYEKTIIKQTGTAGTNDATKRCVTMKDGAQLIGLTLTGGNTTDTNAGGAGVYVDSGDATISWCCVTNNTAWFCGGGIGIGKSGTSAAAPQHVKIDHTIVADNSSTGNSDYRGAGIGTKAGYLELEVDTCLIYGNHNTSKDGGGIGLKAGASSNYVKSRIVNTTIADNSTTGKGGGIWVENVSNQTVLNETTLINCIFSGNSATGTAEFGDANVGSNNEATYNLMKSKSGCCFFGTGSTAETAFGAFAKTGDVGFVGDGNYHLAANSPAIAAGSTIAADRVDLDNVAFVAPPSVGCYEYESSVPAPKFTPASGTKFQTQLEVRINGQGTVYYTTDGTVPTEGSSTYSSARTISDTTKFMARSYLNGVWSAVASATYVKSAPDAGDYYVSTEGSDFADGLTPATAFKTIAHAVEVANEGQKVTILPGTFEIDETIVIDKAITVTGSGWDETTIQPTSGTKIRLVELDNGAKLEGVTLTGGNVSGGDGAAAVVKNGMISWCYITNNKSTDSSGSGAAVAFIGGQGTIDHCVVTKNTGTGTYCCGSVGARNVTAAIIVIDTCLIYDNTTWNVGGVGIVNGSPNVTIRNCTIANNKGSGYGGITAHDCSGATVAIINTISVGNDKSNIYISPNTTSSVSTQNCIFEGEAQFTNAGEGDYHPSAGWEDVIGKGVTYAGIGDTLDGSPFNDPPSIGCYEPSIGFGKVTFAYPAKHVGTATVQLIGLSDGATTANVTFQYGPDSEHLCEPAIVVTNGVVIKTDIVATMTDLNANCEYAYRFTAVDDKGQTATRSGVFMTDDWDTLQFSTVKANPTSNSADVSVTIMKLGLGATNATVYVQWGTNYNDLCQAIRISTTASQKQTLTYTIPGLKNETDYVVRFSGENDVGDTATRDGAFKTLEKEKLALGEPKVSNLGQTTADIAVTVPTLGEGANSATVTLKWWIDGTTDTNSVVMSSAAVRGSSLSQQITGLTANKLYLYEIEAVNDLPSPETETKSVTGGFTTDDPNIGADDYHDSYLTVDANHVVTYDADSAGNPSTLEPGSPYVVVAKEGYGVSHPAGGKTYWFRNEYDYQYNCSARIGDTYYLLLSDAVAAASSGATIELLRNNYAIGVTMQISRKLTIEGNGYAVKVAAPFLDTTGYVNPKCTATPKTVFKIGTGGDVVINDMLVMGGGEQLATGGAGSNSANEPAIVVTDTGILEMDHVTVKRSQGGLWIGAQAKVHLNACNLVKNARFCGGGLYSLGVLVMENSSLSENRSLSSGGGGAAAENQGLLVMNNCVICNNGSTEYGGAINNLKGTAVVYMMNMTMAGNFTSNKSDNGGGIGLHQAPGALYMVNSILCNNYHYDTTSGQGEITDSDIYALTDVGNVNNIYYSVYGVAGGSDVITFHDCWKVVAADEDVFKDYTKFSRTYEQAKTTGVPIPGPLFDYAPSNEDARYAPLTENGSKADVDNEGVYTYFDASAWRSAEGNSDVSWLKMAYREDDDTTLTALGNCAMADEEDLVTTYYETAFDPTISDREPGVVGASGFGTHKKTYTLILLENPVNGGVSDNLDLYGKSYNQGAEVTVVATPDAKCTFLGWFDAKDATEPVSTKLAYKFVMDSNKSLLARFSEPSETVIFYEVKCEQTEGDHDLFQIEITKDWLGKVFPTICPGGEVTTTEVKALVEAELNKPDSANGLNHVWQNYVLGQMSPGDPDGRIWIRGAQYYETDKLTFNIQEFAETKDCGFLVRYRLAKKDITKGETEFNRSGEYKNNTVGKFNDPVSEDIQYCVIDMIFIPTTAGKNNKLKLDTSFEYVTTVNTAGVMKVNSDKRVEILASPFVGFSPTNNPTIKATDYVKASCLNKDDVLYIYDRAHSNYLAWAVQDGQWAQKDTYQIINGVVYKDDDPADIANTNSLPRGMGAWLERSNTKSPIYLYGQVDPSPVTTTLEPGFNLVGNPYPFTYDASQLPPGEDEKGVVHTGMYGDHIVVPTGADPINAIYDEKEQAWMWPSNAVVPMVNPKTGKPMLNPDGTPRMSVKDIWTTEGLTLPIGHGFWYNNTSGRSMDLNWASED